MSTKSSFSMLVTIGLLVCFSPAVSGRRASTQREGMLETSDTNLTSANCDLSRYSNLRMRFENLQYAGAGANGCVVLANDKENDGVKVAIKLSKRPGKLRSWQTECDQTKAFHKLACQTNELQLRLSERFLPNCLEVGGDDNAPYMIMHAAGGQGIGGGKQLRSTIPAEERLSTFAQIVGAVASLHGISMSHNDLHDNNVVYLHKGVPTTIALIDFGETVPLERGQYTWSYKQDETLILRKAQELANCPGWVHQKPPNDKAVFLSCLRRHWSSEGADEEFFKVLGKAYDEAKDRDRHPTQVLELFKTAFIQKHLPKMGRLFPNTECSGKAAPTVVDTEMDGADGEPTVVDTEMDGADGEPTVDTRMDGTDEVPAVVNTSATPLRSPYCKSSDNPGCNKLSGRCCPSKSGTMLACCG